MDQKEALRQEIEQKLLSIDQRQLFLQREKVVDISQSMCSQLDHIKKIMVEASWDGVSEEDVLKATATIADLMIKFNFTKG